MVCRKAHLAAERARKREDLLQATERELGKVGQMAALDGIYALRSTCTKELLTSQAMVRVYKQLKMAERAYRTINEALDVRPIRHYLTQRVEAHFFLFLLAYYLLFEPQARPAPMLYTDEAPVMPAAPVAPAQRSNAATPAKSTSTHQKVPARDQE